MSPANKNLQWTGERYVPEITGSIRLEHLHRYLIARELSRNKRVLDIACGEGYGSDLLASVAADVVGVDVAQEAIDHAAARYSRPNLRFKQGSCEAIPLPDGAVDVVVSFETIEHLSLHDAMMREIRRVLGPDGLLVISNPERHEYSEVLGNKNVFHVKELYRDEFEQLLRNHFLNVAIGGQRIQGGSIVAPLGESTNTRFVTFPFSEESAEVNPVPGILAPVYILALASDKPVPDIPFGVFDGGQFVWASDWPALLSEVQGQWAEEISRRLGDPVNLSGASPETVAAEFTRQAERVANLVNALATQNAQAQEPAAKLSAQLRRADDRVRELQGTLTTFRARLSAAEYQIMQLKAQVETYERSRSWRLTAPLRAIRRRVSAVPRSTDFERPTLSLDRVGDVAGIPKADDGSRSPAAAAGFRPSGVTPKGAYDDTTEDYVALDRSTPVDTRIRLIAFYLPQFHPIPENDAWWGRGFTEWTSVTRARPRFEGHYQPHLPGELGFYDLRVPDVQRRQVELARLHGIHGFCFYHYWFHGRKLLQRPLEQFLSSDIDFAFCLCWANENWTRRWDGRDDECLMAQQHSAEDDLAFIRDIEPALRDRRCIRIGDRPLLLVYRPDLFPDARATAQRWREYCRDAGIGELYLMSTHAFDQRNPHDFGFDAALEFVPNTVALPPIERGLRDLNPKFQGRVHAYRSLVEATLERDTPREYPFFRSVTPMWDNEARRPNHGMIFAGSSPALYRHWLESTCRWTERHVQIEPPLVFVNAWNEWGEGAHLEPDRRYGYAYLKATADALEQFPARGPRPTIVFVSHDALFYGAQLIALNLVRTLSSRLGYNVDVILCGPGPLTTEFESVGRVHDFARPELTRNDKLAVVRQLYDRGARVAICNTSVVGDTVELLKLAGFSVVSLIHELPGVIHAYGLESSVQHIAEHADRVVFPAGIVRDGFASLTGIALDRTVLQPQGLIAPNGFFGRRDSARHILRATLGIPESTRIVLGVGTADHRKGVDLFVEVGIDVGKRVQDVVFVWIGHQNTTAFASTQTRVKETGLSNRIIFPGPVRESDVFFAGADVFLMTSREDPFPNVVVEALDAALPVIGFEGAGGFVELLSRGCGILVPFEDTAAMARSVIRLLDCPAEAAQLTKTGREILSTEFSFVNYARTLVELVEGRRPTVTVIVPNYNYARYLPERLQSIVDQTSPPYEVLFLDDCSTDNSVEVAEQLLHASGLSYRIIKNETNQGTYRQWLRGIREARGDLLWIAEADDHCEPCLLKSLVSQFENPGVVLAFCQSRQIDEAGNELAPDYLAWTADISETKWRERYIRPGVDEICDTLAVKNTIPNVSAVLMRRIDPAAIESKLVSLRNTGDWLLYVHLLEHGSIAFVPDALNSHRRHASSATLGSNGLQLMREILMVQQHVIQRHPVTTDAERKRETDLQRTYEYLGLRSGGPASYKDHEALRRVEWVAPG